MRFYIEITYQTQGERKRREEECKDTHKGILAHFKTLESKAEYRKEIRARKDFRTLNSNTPSLK